MTGGTCSSFIVPNYEYESTLVEFEEELDGNDNKELSRQFRMLGDVWSIVEYIEVKCGFC